MYLTHKTDSDTFHTMMCGYVRKNIIPKGKIWENPEKGDLSCTVTVEQDLVNEQWKEEESHVPDGGNIIYGTEEISNSEL